MTKQVFEKAKWVWHSNEYSIDDRAEFYGALKFTRDIDNVICRLSCDSDYALYINGKFVSSNQYGDFPYYKAYDEIDVTKYLIEGNNHVFIQVWYFGVGSQKYFPSSAGLIFEFVKGDSILLASDENVFARQGKTYAIGRAKNISSQLGMSFLYDLSAEDGAKTGEVIDFKQAVVVEKDCSFFLRPNKKLSYGNIVEPFSVSVSHGNRTILVDLGREVVGLATLKFDSSNKQKITVVFGEKLVSDNVQRFIGGNDYSFEVVAKAGRNEFFDPFLRIGCRYLQIIAEEPIQVEYLSLIPVFYPLQERKKLELSKNDLSIYDLCLNTLKLCALEHFVDCPFREQGLYAFDSRNQMLAGYYAFGGRDYFDYAKSNLLLFSKDNRKDKLLSITTPSNADLLIPSFSLHYVIAVSEYLEYSGDTSLEKSIIEKIEDIMQVFSSRVEFGLLRNVISKNTWNFYDWSKGADYCTEEIDIFSNCLYLLAIKAYKKISKLLGVKHLLKFDEDQIRSNIYTKFFDKKEGLFSVTPNKKLFTQLGNSLAILAGVVSGQTAIDIIDKMIERKTISCSLSAKVHYYDALLLTNRQKYEEIVLKDIRKNYGYMLKKGATATWETLEGEKAFDGSGSLCHGWSAYPIYYYNLILGGQND